MALLWNVMLVSAVSCAVSRKPCSLMRPVSLKTGQADADDAACKFRQLALLLWILLYQVVDKGK